MATTIVYGQDPPLDLDFVIYRGGFWRADLEWLTDNGSAVLVAGKAMQLRWERSAYGGTYPPDLDSTQDPIPDLDTIDYLQMSDGQVEIGLTSATTAALDFSSTIYRIFLLTDGVPELWAKGRMRLVA